MVSGGSDSIGERESERDGKRNKEIRQRHTSIQKEKKK